MKKRRVYSLASIFTAFVLFQFILVISIQAQDRAESKPELSVAGIELGNRESAEKFLKSGFSPRLEKDGSVGYYFYNKWANQVMRLSAPSLEDKYFITEIEVFSVSRKYQKPHFQAKDHRYFETENGIFIGFKQSAMFLIVGLKNAGKINEFKPKHIVKIKGEPTTRNKMDKKREAISYKVPSVELSDSESSYNYEASYRFYKNKLKRFKIKIAQNKSELAKK